MSKGVVYEVNVMQWRPYGKFFRKAAAKALVKKLAGLGYNVRWFRVDSIKRNVEQLAVPEPSPKKWRPGLR